MHFLQQNKIFKMRLIFSLLFSLTLVFNLSAQDNLERWYHMDPASGMNGVSADKAYEELLKGKKSMPIVVAIIDSGVDIEHEDLKDVIWVNEDEIPDNGIDDDKNGYIDDVYGWNFIGGPDGKNVNHETYEVTRLYAKYRYKYEDADPNLLNEEDKKEYEKFLEYQKEVNEKREAAADAILEIAETEKNLKRGFDSLQRVMTSQNLELSMENLQALTSEDPNVIMGKQVAMSIMSSMPEINTFKGLDKALDEAIDEQKERYQTQLAFAYNPDFDSRELIVKDDYSNSEERYYGNNDVVGPDALHGTHVAGIVAQVRNNDLGGDGIADNVKIMSVRTVPNGDERDKDVANAIRYAVDNGASIINMSFGKGYSWDKEIVDEAVQYAVKNDVLLVHAAGNSALNTDENDNFPNATYEEPTGCWLFGKTKGADTWIEVGALSHNPEDKMVATFSNYGKENVDIFAPGEQIYAAVPGNKYRFLRGTSMASPVVAGVAAVLRSYFPKLKAEQVKEILLETAVPVEIDVIIPGDKSKTVKFTELSRTGGVVNLYNAVKKAQTVKGKKKVKDLDKKMKVVKQNRA